MAEEPKKEKIKTVLVACPTLGLDPNPDRWLVSLIATLVNIRKNRMGFMVHCPYRMSWWPANNQIWDIAFNNDFDYILRMDDDVWAIPPDAFTRLVNYDKPVVGIAYPLRHFPYSIAAMNRNNKTASIIDCHINGDKDPGSMQEVAGTGLQKAELVGMGFTLIRVDDFRQIERPMFKGTEVCPDDSYFAQVCLDNGIQQWVDMDIRAAHREVTPANRGYLFNSDARFMIVNGAVRPGLSQYDDMLIDLFGPDGKKDLGMLKGFGAEKRIVTL